MHPRDLGLLILSGHRITEDSVVCRDDCAALKPLSVDEVLPHVSRESMYLGTWPGLMRATILIWEARRGR